MATKTISCTNRDLRIAMDGASLLATRVLADLNTELRVGKLIRALRPDYQDTEAARDRILAEHPVPKEWDRPDPPLAVAEARNRAFNAFLDEPVEVEVPEHLLITEQMLPVESKTKPTNREGVAQIVAQLGPFFVDAPEAEASA